MKKIFAVYTSDGKFLQWSSLNEDYTAEDFHFLIEEVEDDMLIDKVDVSDMNNPHLVFIEEGPNVPNRGYC